MNCRQIENNVIQWLESALPTEERKTLEEHLSRCEKCRALTDFVTGVMNEMDRVDEVTFSVDFWPRLSRRIDDYERRQSGWLSRGPRLRPVAVAACLLFGVWAGIRLGNVYSERVFRPPVESGFVQGQETMPYVSIFAGVPQGSLAELVIEQTLDERAEP